MCIYVCVHISMQVLMHACVQARGRHQVSSVAFQLITLKHGIPSLNLDLAKFWLGCCSALCCFPCPHWHCWFTHTQGFTGMECWVSELKSSCFVVSTLTHWAISQSQNNLNYFNRLGKKHHSLFYVLYFLLVYTHKFRNILFVAYYFIFQCFNLIHWFLLFETGSHVNMGWP